MQSVASRKPVGHRDEKGATGNRERERRVDSSVLTVPRAPKRFGMHYGGAHATSSSRLRSRMCSCRAA